MAPLIGHQYSFCLLTLNGQATIQSIILRDGMGIVLHLEFSNHAAVRQKSRGLRIYLINLAQPFLHVRRPISPLC